MSALILSNLTTLFAVVLFFALMTRSLLAKESVDIAKPSVDEEQTPLSSSNYESPMQEFNDRFVLLAKQELSDFCRLECTKSQFNACTNVNLIDLYRRAKCHHSRYLIALRHSQSLSQKELAKELTLRAIEISYWENGHPIPYLAAKRISCRYKVPLWRLLKQIPAKRVSKR